MKLETILQLLYTNGHEDIVSRAVQIDNNITLPFKVGDEVIVEIHKDKLPEGKRFKKNDGYGSYGYVRTMIQAVNPYSLKTPYVVLMPNGTQALVEVKDGQAGMTLSEIIDIEAPVARAEAV